MSLAVQEMIYSTIVQSGGTFDKIIAPILAILNERPGGFTDEDFIMALYATRTPYVDKYGGGKGNIGTERMPTLRK